jgi:hypothetical protein
MGFPAAIPVRPSVAAFGLGVAGEHENLYIAFPYRLALEYIFYWRRRDVRGVLARRQPDDRRPERAQITHEARSTSSNEATF